MTIHPTKISWVTGNEIMPPYALDMAVHLNADTEAENRDPARWPRVGLVLARDMTMELYRKMTTGTRDVPVIAVRSKNRGWQVGSADRIHLPFGEVTKPDANTVHPAVAIPLGSRAVDVTLGIWTPGFQELHPILTTSLAPGSMSRAELASQFPNIAVVNPPV